MEKRERPIEDYTLEELREFRIPKEVVYIYTERWYNCNDYTPDKPNVVDWYGCPRCRSVIENAFQDYCGCCGQRVAWNRYAKLCSE